MLNLKWDRHLVFSFNGRIRCGYDTRSADAAFAINNFYFLKYINASVTSAIAAVCAKI
jgi:hypothetical protein